MTLSPLPCTIDAASDLLLGEDVYVSTDGVAHCFFGYVIEILNPSEFFSDNDGPAAFLRTVDINPSLESGISMVSAVPVDLRIKGDDGGDLWEMHVACEVSSPLSLFGQGAVKRLPVSDDDLYFAEALFAFLCWEKENKPSGFQFYEPFGKISVKEIQELHPSSGQAFFKDVLRHSEARGFQVSDGVPISKRRL